MVVFGALACEQRGRELPLDGPVSCADGYLADEEVCVPELCGTGSWGELAVDGSTVHVDAGAAEGGDGSADAPFRGIQAALDLAGERGGGLVVVAAGSYPETLVLTTDHAGVHLAGRCRELVTLDAGVGEDETSGIDIDVRYGEVGISGLRVAGSSYAGVRVVSGTVGLQGLLAEGNAVSGIFIRRTTLAPTVVNVDGCDVVANEGGGIVAYDSGTDVSLIDTVVRDNVPDDVLNVGYGLDVWNGASLSAVGCVITGNAQVGVAIDGEGSAVSLSDTVVGDTFLEEVDQVGVGLAALNGARLTVTSGEVFGNPSSGVVVADPGTRVVLEDTLFHRAGRPGEHAGTGVGLQISDGAVATLDGCTLRGHGARGLAVSGLGTEVSLSKTVVEGTVPDADGEQGYGIFVYGGAVLEASGCELWGNTAQGIIAHDAATSVSLEDVAVLHTIWSEVDGTGYGFQVAGGAKLVATACELGGNEGGGAVAAGVGTDVLLVETIIRDSTEGRSMTSGAAANSVGAAVTEGATMVLRGCALSGNEGMGLAVWGPGTHAVVEDSMVHDTQPSSVGSGGYGSSVWDGAALTVRNSEVVDNTSAGILASDPGTLVTLCDSAVVGTVEGPGSQGAVANGICAQVGASIVASRVTVQDQAGPALVVWHQGARLACTECALLDNHFAAAVALGGGSLELSSSSISGTRESGNLGGGVGIYAAQQGIDSPASLLVTDTLITDNPVAGLYLSGQGSFEISDSTISGGTGIPHGAGARCGDGVFASDVQAWDGGAGARLSGNLITDNAGAGLFLSGASAALVGNVWERNDPDLLVQGEDCGSSREDWAEVPDQELCPQWDRPTCALDFVLALSVVEIEPARVLLPASLSSSPAAPVAPRARHRAPLRLAHRE